jgi:hypothetical protein
MPGRIILNYANETTRAFLESQHPHAVNLFAPVLGHEVTHDVNLTHENPFYDKVHVLNHDLRKTIADNAVNRQLEESFLAGQSIVRRSWTKAISKKRPVLRKKIFD